MELLPAGVDKQCGAWRKCPPPRALEEVRPYWVIEDPLAAATRAVVLERGTADPSGARGEPISPRPPASDICSYTRDHKTTSAHAKSQNWCPEVGPRIVGTRAPPTTQHAKRASSLVSHCLLSLCVCSRFRRVACVRPLLRWDACPAIHSTLGCVRRWIVNEVNAP